MRHTWFDARAECDLYGGWLVQINSQEEYNCLMRHGTGANLDDTYWTDVNDVGNTGVWTHAFDDSAVSFYPPRVLCHCTDNQPGCSNGGDVYILSFENDRHVRGNYCDRSSSQASKFICEALY